MTAQNGLRHADRSGKANMVDVSEKSRSLRTARAEALIELSPDAIQAIEENSLAKGDVLTVARIAAIQAAKRTSELIPLCHQIPLSSISVTFDTDHTSNRITITTEARTNAETGVEMEALTAASIAALTIYDMTKSLSKAHRILQIQLLSKEGGKSGTWLRNSDEPLAQRTD
jgi:cyclic pyranopterin phosphate synthase